jgi:glycosyltransferase involved in cell wall biosynthesis
MKHNVDILHLSKKPHFMTGSFNRFIYEQIRQLGEFRQMMISYGDKEKKSPAEKGLEDSFVLVNGKGLNIVQKLFLRLPNRSRASWFNGITGPEKLIYLWQIAKLLPRLKPKIIIFYEQYKMGIELRKVINWPCRFVLAQRRFSHFLEKGEFKSYCSLEAYDTIWTQTHAAYRFDKARADRYEPLVKVIPNAVDVHKFRPVSTEQKRNLRAKWNLPEDRLIVLLLSRQVPKKGAHLLLHSWPKILSQAPNAYLWIVGGGDSQYRKYLEKMIGVMDLHENVRLQGAVVQSDIHTCYQSADVYVFPTLHPEGMANTLLEAAATGLPCIAAEHEGAMEHYSKDEIIFVPDPNVEDVFIEPVLNLIKNDALRESLQHAARKRVEQHYSQEIVFDQLREFYHRQLLTVV